MRIFSTVNISLRYLRAFTASLVQVAFLISISKFISFKRMFSHLALTPKTYHFIYSLMNLLFYACTLKNNWHILLDNILLENQFSMTHFHILFWLVRGKLHFQRSYRSTCSLFTFIIYIFTLYIALEQKLTPTLILDNIEPLSFRSLKILDTLASF